MQVADVNGAQGIGFDSLDIVGAFTTRWTCLGLQA